MWRSLNGDLDRWPNMSTRLMLTLAGAQAVAAGGADEYVDGALDGDVEAAGAVAAGAFAGIASDGRPLDGLLQQPAVATRVALSRGATIPRAFATGQSTLSMILRTQVADAGRVADGVAIAARPDTGYVRVLQGKTCSRCVILAGKFYRYNAGFQRHPACDCLHVPAKGEAAARSEGLITDPKEAFDSMSKAEQDRVFTNAGAQAIRDGADMNQVVNVRRGAAGLTPAGARITADEARMLRGGRDVGRLETRKVFGQDVFISTEGTTTRGVAGTRLGARNTGLKRGKDRYRRAQAPRLMPESIYQVAESREHAIQLLRKFGYII